MRRSAFLVSLLVFISIFAVYCTYVVSMLNGGPSVSLPRINLIEEVPLPMDKNQDLRLLFVGDVHGQYHEMVQLFEKTGLDDTMVVLLGDFLAKGPESAKVADFVLEHKDKVKCVLGNHDLAVMFAFLNPAVAKFPFHKKRRNLKPIKFTQSEEFFYPDDMTKIKRMHWEISHQIGPEKMVALAQHCSAALHFDLGEKKIFAVHAGLFPYDFNNKVPSVRALTEMKYVDKNNWSKLSKEKENKNYIRWFKLWKGSKLPDELSTTYVLYGHDASKGLNIKGHTMGLDTGCVKGGELTGMEFSRKLGEISTKLHQVKCGGARRAAIAAMEQKAQNEGKEVHELDEWKNLANTGKSPPSPHNESPGAQKLEESNRDLKEPKSEKDSRKPDGNPTGREELRPEGRLKDPKLD